MAEEKRVVKQAAKGENIQQVAGNLIIKSSEDIQSTFEDAAKLINEGSAKVAEVLLERLWRLHNDKMTPRQKSNCWRLLGCSCDRQDKMNDAGKYFLKAKDYDPEWEKARVFEAVGYTCLGNRAKAYTLAENVLQEYSQNNLAWSVWIQTAPGNLSFSELESKVPEHLRSDTEVAVALAVRAATEGCLDIAEEYMAKAEKEAPDNPRVTEKLGELMVQRVVVNEPVFEQRGPSKTAQIILQHAVEFYSASLVKWQEEQATNSIIRVRSKRSWAYAALQQQDLATADITYAYELNPDNPSTAYSYAATIGRERLEDAIAVLRRVVGKDEKPGVEHLLAQMLRQRNQDSDLAKAIILLKSRLKDLENTADDFRVEYISLLLELERELSGKESAMETLKAISDEAINSRSRAILHAQILSKQDDKNDATKLVKEIFSDLDDNTPVEEGRCLANLMMTIGLYREALSLWKGITRTDCIGPDTLNMINCAKCCGAEKDILDLCVKLRESEVWDRNIFEYEIYLHQKYNDWRTCKQILQNYIQKPLNEEYLPYVRAHLSHVAAALKEIDLIETDISQLPSPNEVNPGFGCLIVQSLRIGGEPFKAADFAYELVRMNWKSLDAHLNMANFMLPMGSKPLELDHPTVVVPGTAVQYEEMRAGIKKWHIIEDSKSGVLDISRNEYSVNHTYSEKMMNLKKGDSFLLRGGEIQERRATILEILSKYHYRITDCMDGLEDRFPDCGAVIKIDAYREDGQIDLDPIKRMADLGDKQANELLQLYKEQPLPIYFIAAKRGRDLSSTLEHLISQSTIEIHCRSGDRSETEAAIKGLEEADEIVLDEMTLATLVLCGVCDYLPKITKKLVVSEGTLLNIENWEVTRTDANNPGMSAGNVDGKLVLLPRSKETVEAIQGEIRGLTRFIRECCTVESGVALGLLDSSQRDLFVKTLGQACSETIALSRKERRVLWTDDFTSAALLIHSLGGARVWTQLVFEYLAGHGVIGASTVRELTLKLISFRYWFTSLNAETAIDAISKSNWDVNSPPLKQVLAHFGDKRVTLDANLILTICRLLKHCWNEDRLGLKASAVTVRILNELAKRGKAPVIVEALWIGIQRVFGLDVLTSQKIKRIFDDWLAGYGGGIIIP